MKKSWWQSKTLWVNIFVAVLATMESTTGLLAPYLAAHWYVAVAVGLPIVNVVLRIVTTQGLKA